MSTGTQSPDFVFRPKVWADHVDAFFRRKLVFGALALNDNTLTAAPGETINFPFFKKIGDAEEPAEDEGLLVDKLQDDSFNATVKEVAKAVGVNMKAIRVSAARRERIFAEVQRQIGQVHAEKVDKDLVAEMSTVGNYVEGYTAAGAADVMDIRKLNEGKIVGFGDRANEAIAVFMHSLQWLDLQNDLTAGFLKADANSPFSMIDGYSGSLLRMAVIVTDNVPEVAGGIGGKKAYDSFVVKRDPYGFMTAEMPEMERDKDILHREWVFAGTQWYAVKGFHAKVASDDFRVARLRTSTSQDL